LFTKNQKNAKNMILMYFFDYSNCILRKIKLLEKSGVVASLSFVAGKIVQTDPYLSQCERFRNQSASYCNCF